MSAEARVETKEERKARKEATKAAKAAAASTQADGVTMLEDSVEPATAGADQEKKRKKEKKRKAEEETAAVEKAAEIDMEASEKKRRKEEKRAAKRKAATEAEPGAGAGIAVASSSTDVEKIAESAADKKKEKKDKKDKKRKRTEEVAVADTDADGSTRYSPSVPVATVQPEVEGSSSDPVAPSEETSSTPKPPKRPKRSKLEKQQAAEAAAAEAAAELARRKAAGEDVEESSAVPVEVAEVEPLEGAYGDESLTESAKKSLAYCEQYVASHATTAEEGEAKTWKFQKAKQNWLVKHFWDDAERETDEQVPDAYVDVVITYLKTIQGGGRKGLIDAAKKRRDAPVPVAEPATTGEPAAETGEQAAADTPAEQPVATTEGDATATADAAAATATESQVDEEAARKHGLAKARAEKLLKAMGAR